MLTRVLGNPPPAVSGLTIVTFAPGTSASTRFSSSLSSVAVTVAIARWLLTRPSPPCPVDVAPRRREVGEGVPGRRAASRCRLDRPDGLWGPGRPNLESPDPHLDAMRCLASGSGRDRRSGQRLVRPELDVSARLRRRGRLGRGRRDGAGRTARRLGESSRKLSGEWTSRRRRRRARGDREPRARGRDFDRSRLTGSVELLYGR